MFLYSCHHFHFILDHYMGEKKQACFFPKLESVLKKNAFKFYNRWNRKCAKGTDNNRQIVKWETTSNLVVFKKE